MDIIKAIGIGLSAGILSGLLGVGGGIIIVPSLAFLLGFTQHLAQGTSLAMLLLPVGIMGVYKYYTAGSIDLRIAAILALGYFLGSYTGASISLTINPVVMRKIFATFVICIGIAMLMKK